ncbi:hypothetical protein A0J61_10172 [Choanephora cucurbitarum]|uniref:Uncharacterized protein n=1 Tax=Choanephora cucurbitarum TaxID=101091 RepID=A0A1C7MYC6_9FUNG|nr:hypothetical protein A0J61_10172 [Choanephora cucurbitarum]
MIPPLQHTFGSLPPDNPTSNPPTSLEPLPDTQLSPHIPLSALPLSTSSASSFFSPKPLAMSYAAVAVSSRIRKETVLYRSSIFDGHDNDNTHSLVHKTGTADHSVFYHVPKNFRSFKI